MAKSPDTVRPPAQDSNAESQPRTWNSFQIGVVCVLFSLSLCLSLRSSPFPPAPPSPFLSYSFPATRYPASCPLHRHYFSPLAACRNMSEIESNDNSTATQQRQRPRAATIVHDDDALAASLVLAAGPHHQHQHEDGGQDQSAPCCAVKTPGDRHRHESQNAIPPRRALSEAFGDDPLQRHTALVRIHKMSPPTRFCRGTFVILTSRHTRTQYDRIHHICLIRRKTRLK